MSNPQAPQTAPHKVVVIGSGFGGLFGTKALRRAETEAAGDASKADRAEATIAGGGSSPAKWRVSLTARWRAVRGSAARSASSFSPTVRVPSTSWSPSSFPVDGVTR